MSWKFWQSSIKKDPFVAIFQKQAEIAGRTTDMFRNMVLSDNALSFLPTIKESEHKGDNAHGEIYALLNTTFITRFDATDIKTLAKALDDISDLVKEAAMRMVTYRLIVPNDDLREMADELFESIAQVQLALANLDKFSLEHVTEIRKKIKQIEQANDAILEHRLGDVFYSVSDMVGIRYFVVFREIAEKIEKATDRCQHAIDIICDIVQKEA